MALSYQFLWNKDMLVIEFINGDEQGNRVVEYQVRLPRDEAVIFGQQVVSTVNFNIKKINNKTVDTPMPLPQ